MSAHRQRSAAIVLCVLWLMASTLLAQDARLLSGPPFKSPTAAEPPRIPDWSDGTAASVRSPVRGPSVKKLAKRGPATPRLARVATTQFTSPVTEPYLAASSSPVPSSGSSQCDSCDCARCSGVAFGPALGASLNLYYDAHIRAGHRARQVLYRYDFENRRGADRSRLNRFGRAKLRRLAEMMEFTGEPLVIQDVPGERSLSESRRAHVITVLQTQLGLPLSEDRVVVSAARMPGLHGVEATEIRRNQLQTTRSQGIVTSGFQSGLTNNVSTGTGNQQ